MKKRILIVGHEEDNRITIKEILEKNGFDVFLAANGDDCLRQLEKNKVDLILLNILMPGKPVREVIKNITNTKIAYFSTVRTSEAEREELLKPKNIVDFIQKPFDVNELLKKVKKHTL